MWKIIYILGVLAAIVAFYQMKTAKPDVILVSVCVVIFMVAMMKLSSRTKSKNIDDEQKHD